MLVSDPIVSLNPANGSFILDNNDGFSPVCELVWRSGKGMCQVGSTNVQESRDSTVALWMGCVTETATPRPPEAPAGPWE